MLVNSIIGTWNTYNAKEESARRLAVKLGSCLMLPKNITIPEYIITAAKGSQKKLTLEKNISAIPDIVRTMPHTVSLRDLTTLNSSQMITPAKKAR